eukprot:250380-Chlamydomonas_euryale.AAC.1
MQRPKPCTDLSHGVTGQILPPFPPPLPRHYTASATQPSTPGSTCQASSHHKASATRPSTPGSTCQAYCRQTGPADSDAA